MKVINVHQRIIPGSKEEIARFVSTLSSREDEVWPYENWPRMKLDNGLNTGSKGGHGPIRYFVNRYLPDSLIEFEFTFPKGFKGTHRFELKALDKAQTEIKHTIDMETSGLDTVSWILVIRWLHDALTEDAFDKIENKFNQQNKVPKWSLWVRIWRKFLNPKKR